VLAGGESRRYGSDKLAVLLDEVLAGLPARVPVVCVGPVRRTPGRPDVLWVREDPPGTGPLAAVGAAVRRDGAGAPVVVLVAGDMPRVGAAVPSLVAALEATGDGPHDGEPVVVLLDAAGRRQPLASAWRRTGLLSALDRIGDLTGVPLHRVLDGVTVVELPDSWGAAVDVDTPADL